MKFENQDNPWQWWQVGRLRSYMRSRMKPMTPQVALRKKERVAAMYCLAAFGLFHYELYKLGYLKRHIDPVDTALNQMDEGKIYTFNNFKLEKVQDFDSSEYNYVPRKREYQTI